MRFEQRARFDPGEDVLYGILEETHRTLDKSARLSSLETKFDDVNEALD